MKPHILIIFAFFSSSVACGFSSQISPPIEVTAKQVIEDYNENLLTSDEKYGGKKLLITGTISHYGQINGIVGVYLKGDLKNESTVICLIDKTSQPDIYNKLKQGVNGTFEGIGEPKKDEKSIFIKNCMFKGF